MEGNVSDDENVVSRARRWTLPDLPLGDVNSFYKYEVKEYFPAWSDMLPFWSAYRDWLAARGFYLNPWRKFKHHPEELWSPPVSTCAAPLPYAERCTNDIHKQGPRSANLKIATAQDVHGRDVTIKLVNTYTDEYHIYQDLLRCDELFGQDFQGVLPPVAILDTSFKFSFVVMPTWGGYNPLYTFETVRQVIQFMRYMLKGLSFLHSRRVAHRDIDEHNIMNNIYSLWMYGPAFKTTVAEHRRTSRVLYCLFDFNHSVQFPRDKPLRECRLTVDLSTMSCTPYRPLDIGLGVHDYDPLAYDVACIGNMFRVQFPMIVGSVPEFALLFDKMTTHVIHDRFSASEALLHFDQTVDCLSKQALDQEATLEINWDLDNTEVYWSLVRPEVAIAWASQRTPPLSLGTETLWYFSRYRFFRAVLSYVRCKLQI